MDMAHGTPFLVPVVVDDTPESIAIVPEQFMRVQWTRLPQGVPDEKFVSQLKRLLTPVGQPAREAARPRAVPPAEPPPPPLAKKGIPVWLRAALAVVVIGGGLAIALGPKPATRGASKANDKSIAVLPFANMSDDKENAYFADGIHEDILTNLASARELRVVSRTSAMQYRDTKLSMRQIGETLNVAYILEGSVRGRGSKVRVTVQLIDARTDEHAWAKSFDRDLSDIFATQTELAKEIAEQLKATIAAPSPTTSTPPAP
jgi:TolB-like protein